jgi:pimeloyl-ACP methyl ester carboxylesterase
LISVAMARVASLGIRPPNDLRLMAGDVLAVMDAAGVEQADLRGYSMGGRIAIDLLVHAPERFNSVIVGGSGVFTTPMSPVRVAAIVSALETDEVSDVTDDGAVSVKALRPSLRWTECACRLSHCRLGGAGQARQPSDEAAYSAGV